MLKWLVSATYLLWCCSYALEVDHSCECGRAMKCHSRHIVGGQEACPHEFPWMVALYFRGEFEGAGILISDRYILTAAHVSAILKPVSDFKAVLGSHDIRRVKPGIQQVHDIISAVEHPFFEHKRKTNGDIAIFKTKNKITFVKNKIWPICLPFPDKTKYQNVFGTVAGWGKIGENLQPSRYLLKLQLKTIPFMDCLRTKTWEQLQAHFMNDTICAGGQRKDSCQGDSGGPLMYREFDSSKNTVFSVIGVVSSGHGCAREGHPGFYTNVATYRQWILDNTRDAAYCNNPLMIDEK